MDNKEDTIKGRRLTNAESMRLMLPDLPLMDDKILEEVLRPFMTNSEKENDRMNKNVLDKAVELVNNRFSFDVKTVQKEI